MPEDFVPLTTLLRAGVAATATAPVSNLSPGSSLPAAEHVRLPVAHDDAARDEYAHAATLRELTLMRLAAFEAFERAAASLLATFASDVLGRELALAPADVEALARAALAACGDEPVTIILSLDDAERVHTTLPVRVDRSLAPGDLVVEVRDGALESPLSFRLTAALERAAVAAR